MENDAWEEVDKDTKDNEVKKVLDKSRELEGDK